MCKPLVELDLQAINGFRLDMARLFAEGTARPGGRNQTKEATDETRIKHRQETKGLLRKRAFTGVLCRGGGSSAGARPKLSGMFYHPCASDRRRLPAPPAL